MSDGRAGGFIKLHRQIEDWPLWRSMTAAQRMVWVQMLIMANWKDDAFWYGSTRIEVRRGQLAHSEAEIADRAGVGRKVVRQAIEKLQAEGAVRREKAPLEGQAPHLVTIVNYERYQSSPEDEGPREGQERAKRGPSEGQGRALREEGEEGEEGKKTTLPRKRAARGPDPRHHPMQLALEAAFLEARGTPYGFLSRDAKAVQQIVALSAGSEAEAVRRFKTGLGEIGFRRCDSIHDLAQKWNAYATTPPMNGVPRPVTAPASPPSAFAKGGPVAL